jgi:hypothetical protein
VAPRPACRQDPSRRAMACGVWRFRSGDLANDVGAQAPPRRRRRPGQGTRTFLHSQPELMHPLSTPRASAATLRARSHREPASKRSWKYSNCAGRSGLTPANSAHPCLPKNSPTIKSGAETQRRSIKQPRRTAVSCRRARGQSSSPNHPVVDTLVTPSPRILKRRHTVSCYIEDQFAADPGKQRYEQPC